MKKFFLTLAIAFVAATTASAQLGGLSVGAGYQSYTDHADYTVTLPIVGAVTFNENDPYAGFYAGLSYNLLTLGPGINIVPGLYFSSASYKSANNGDIQAKQNFLGIPVNFSYKLDVVPGTLALEPYAGPTFSFALGYKTTSDNWKNTTDMYSDDSDLGKFNLALGGGLALNIVDMIRVTVGYNYYLLNLYKGDGAGTYQRNGVLNFGVAYLFK